VKILEETGIEVIPVETQLDAWLNVFSITEEELIAKLASNLGENEKIYWINRKLGAAT